MKKLTVLLLSMLFICVFAGCGAADTTSEPSFTPDTVRIVMPLSSRSPQSPITDPDTVAYLWSVYQGLEFDGTEKELSKENTWCFIVTFTDSATGETEKFELYEKGTVHLGEDYETHHYATNGEEAFLIFLNAFDESLKA